MSATLDLRVYAQFPFLKKAQKYVDPYTTDIFAFLLSPLGHKTIERAEERISVALSFGRSDEFTLPKAEIGEIGLKLEIYSYAFARILISCMHDRSAIERYCRYEAERATWFLERENEEIRDLVAEEIGIDPTTKSIPVTTYIELAAGMRGGRWRLVNREVSNGLVVIECDEMEDLKRERIRTILAHQLPLPVPGELCERLLPSIERIHAQYQQQMLVNLGPIDESRYPPCMAALIMALASGANLTHMGRFALTAFLHTIGLSITQIVEVYQRSPDFDIEKTLYQVEHISGRSGTEYTPPSCATMETNGLCVRRDALCERIGGPLGYYRKKKGSPPPAEPPSGSSR